MEGTHTTASKSRSTTRKPQVYLPMHQMSSRSKPGTGTTSGHSGTAHNFATNKPGNKSVSGEHTSGRPCQEHSFLTDVADVRQMEQGLLQLLDDFHSGKLQAFGQDCTFEKMDQVREQQEKLARLHFEIDGQQDLPGVDSTESREAASKNLSRLVDNLQELCTSIQNLQKEHPAPPQS